MPIRIKRPCQLMLIHQGCYPQLVTSGIKPAPSQLNTPGVINLGLTLYNYNTDKLQLPTLDTLPTQGKSYP